MAINIFEYPYKTEENIWTASLIKTLSNTDVTVINKFFAEIGLAFRIKKMKEVNFDMQVHEEESVPDAVLEGQNKSFIIGIEVKKWDTLDVGQIKKHLESYINKEHKEKCFLIITNHYSGLRAFEWVFWAWKSLSDRLDRRQCHCQYFQS
jgi:hypothetical protein